MGGGAYCAKSTTDREGVYGLTSTSVGGSGEGTLASRKVGYMGGQGHDSF